MRQRVKTRRAVFLLALAGLSLGAAFQVGCGSTDIEPFVETDLAYSIYGYLDATADTQFIAVTPIRDSVFVSPGPIDAEFTHGRLDTGERWSWRDTLITLSDGSLTRLFWTTAPVEPGVTYDLVIRRTDGAVSRAEVTMPPLFPPPVFESAGVTVTVQTILFEGVDTVADVQVIYTVIPEGSPSNRIRIVSSLRARATRFSTGETAAVFSASEDLRRGLGPIECARVERVDVVVAAGSPDWPDVELLELDLDSATLPQTINNVTGGLGYVGGVVQYRARWPGLEGIIGSCGR